MSQRMVCALAHIRESDSFGKIGWVDFHYSEGPALFFDTEVGGYGGGVDGEKEVGKESHFGVSLFEVWVTMEVLILLRAKVGEERVCRF